MKVRYCSLGHQCACGWGSINCLKDGTTKIRSCLDDPMEENCNNIVDDQEVAKGNGYPFISFQLKEEGE